MLESATARGDRVDGQGKTHGMGRAQNEECTAPSTKRSIAALWAMSQSDLQPLNGRLSPGRAGAAGDFLPHFCLRRLNPAVVPVRTSFDADAGPLLLIAQAASLVTLALVRLLFHDKTLELGPCSVNGCRRPLAADWAGMAGRVTEAIDSIRALGRDPVAGQECEVVRLVEPVGAALAGAVRALAP